MIYQDSHTIVQDLLTTKSLSGEGVDDTSILDAKTIIDRIAEEFEDFPEYESRGFPEFTTGEDDEITIHHRTGGVLVFSFEYDYDGFYDRDSERYVILGRALAGYSWATYGPQDENGVSKMYSEGGDTIANEDDLAMVVQDIIDWSMD